MANTVNVTKANTFKEWRVKHNEIGTTNADIDTLNSAIGSGCISTFNAVLKHNPKLKPTEESKVIAERVGSVAILAAVDKLLG